MKQKLLKPSLREKKRYLVYQVISERDINPIIIKENILKTFKEYFGNIILSKADMRFIDYKDNKGIIRINNKYLDNLRASFCLLGKVNKEEIIVRSLGVSGMINKARSKFMNGGVS
ncbi:MAG: Rpp14/Pop5 family protein [Nanoarchaeota archaeon]